MFDHVIPCVTEYTCQCDISGAIFSTELGMNRTMEEEAFRIALDHINNDTFNYPEIQLRGLTRLADPTDDFDNIEKG